MTPVLLFTIFAVGWALYAVPAARRRFKIDSRSLAFGMCAAVVSAAGFFLAGFLVGRSSAALWWLALPIVLVLVATVLAERRRATVLGAHRTIAQPAHDG